MLLTSDEVFYKCVLMLVVLVCVYRGMFLAVDAQAAAPVAHHAAQHHIPDVRLPPSLRRLVLPQRCHLLHRQDRRVHLIQLRVSTI